MSHLQIAIVILRKEKTQLIYIKSQKKRLSELKEVVQNENVPDRT